MTKTNLGVALGAMTALLGLFACGGSTEGTSSCLATALGSSCFSCVQTHCGSQLSDFESACSDYLSCLCPGGNFSCSMDEPSACQARSSESGCTASGTTIDACVEQNCDSECSSGGGAACGGGASTSTVCGGTASADGGSCANGELLTSCSATTGNTTSCYYMVGSQQFDCTSCADTSGCAQAANAACQ